MVGILGSLIVLEHRTFEYWNLGILDSLNLWGNRVLEGATLPHHLQGFLGHRPLHLGSVKIWMARNLLNDAESLFETDRRSHPALLEA